MKILKRLPDIMTLGNLACGFIAILIGDLYISSLLILFGMLLDVFDGAVARKLGVQSELGRELDSMADMVSFVVAPAYLYFMLCPMDSYLCYLGPTIYAAAGGLRLAKFNLLEPSKFFIGLPSPSAALFIVGIVLAAFYKNDLVLELLDNVVIFSVIPIGVGLLMLSPIRMFSFKSLKTPWHSNKLELALLVFLIMFIILAPDLALPITILAYVILSFVSWRTTPSV